MTPDIAGEIVDISEPLPNSAMNFVEPVSELPDDFSS